MSKTEIKAHTEASAKILATHALLVKLAAQVDKMTSQFTHARVTRPSRTDTEWK